MLAGASIVTERSPYIVRTSFTLAQSAVIIGDWAAKERHQEGRDVDLRLCSRERRAAVFQGAVHRRWR